MSGEVFVEGKNKDGGDRGDWGKATWQWRLVVVYETMGTPGEGMRLLWGKND